jgi:hypothetical protein
MTGSTFPTQATNTTGTTTNGIFTATANSILSNKSGKDDWITPTPGSFFGATIVLVVITVLIPLFLPATFTYVAQKVTKPHFRRLAWWIWLVISVVLNLAAHIFGVLEGTFFFEIFTLGIMFFGGCWWYYYTRNERPGIWRRMWLRKWYIVFWLSLVVSSVMSYMGGFYFLGLIPYIVYFLVLLGVLISRCFRQRRARVGKR